MNLKNCQTELPPGARFCMNCGQAVERTTPSDEERRQRLASAAPQPLVEKAQAANRLSGERRFGAPVAHEDCPGRAVHAALELLDDMRTYAQTIREKHGVEFGVRISLSTGPVQLGQVSNDLKYEYTALGGTLNLAAQ